MEKKIHNPQSAIRNRKVLVADDEAHIRHVVKIKLTQAGYEVLTAMDGEEALELAITEKPDVIITDYQMPYMSGLELCTHLRKNEPTKDIPILMLTARGFDITEHEMAEVGIRGVLSKPFSPREALRRVQNFLKTTGQDDLTETA
ncbi:MAG: response regulator [Planctomycetota bacterium]|nr:response regulator [Planctomycetota bacterium]